ncbi:MAG: xylanase [Rhodospirillales bacterium CG15_BIG_FIL_POST_REV_8_21_14_020_66_15]|nr:MAG: xylanase [Rhodospirillales bacterium CG15_BIG_FIL_POST_REV_8_21_14_020_66_15]
MIPIGLMFHHFRDGGRHLAGQGAISADQFDALLDAYADRILCAREWRERRLRGDLTSGEICLTFDDGLLCQYDVALPVLQARGLTAFWFPYTGPLAGAPDRLEIYRYFRTLCFPDVDAFYAAFDGFWNGTRWRRRILKGLSDFNPGNYLSEYPFYSEGDRKFRFIRDRILGREAFAEVMDSLIDTYPFDPAQARRNLWMDRRQLRALHEDGHIVGLHSHTHPTRITDQPFDEQKWEIDTNAEWLEKTTGDAPDCIAYPCGDYDGRLLAYLDARGIRIGFQSRLNDASDPMEVPRLDHVLAMDSLNETSIAKGP